MLPLFQESGRKLPLKVLCLGAHSDDIEIGCGGTILRFSEIHPNAHFHWVVFSTNDERRKEAVKSANVFLRRAASHQIVTKSFRDTYFPAHYEELKETFSELNRDIEPDLIFTHFRHDLHQDHRVICELTWNAFRNHFILEYEIPKWDGDLGSPNFFVSLDEKHCREKCRNLLNVFSSQRRKAWFTEDTFRGLMRIRGVESNAPGRYAEGFYCRKISF